MSLQELSDENFSNILISIRPEGPKYASYNFPDGKYMLKDVNSYRVQYYFPILHKLCAVQYKWGLLHLP